MINILKSIGKRSFITFLTLILSVSLYAQKKLIGTVVDEANMPLIGATVAIEGTTGGTITDIDGNFTIRVKKGAVLKFSYVGYKNRKLTYQGQNKITVKLEPESELIDEVVVVGYSSMKKTDLTGSIASVSADDLQGFKSSSIAGALSGQVAGVQVIQSDGAPGSGFEINIRGVGTLTGDNSPLYIVDGFQVDDISYLSEVDIESMQILKDASSAAIYGSRAANGVVLITTRQGKDSKPVISYKGSASHRSIPEYLPVLDAYEFVKLQGEIKNEYADTYYKQGNDSDGNPYKYQTAEDYIGVPYVNWQDETFRNTWSQDHSLTVTGGNDKSKYAASFSRYDEEGIFNNSGFDRTTAKLRVDQKLSKDISFNATINYSVSNKKGAGTTADNGRFNMLAQIISARPTGGLRMTNEELLEYAIDPEMLETGESLAQVNPVKQSQSVTNEKRSELWSANGSITWQIVKGLTFKTAATYTNTNYRTDLFYNDGSKEAYRNGQKPYGQSQMGRDVRWVNSNTLTWKQKIKKHNYTVMLGHEVSQKSSEYLLGASMEFPKFNHGNNNLGLGAVPSKVTSSYYKNSLLSFFAQTTYGYDNRYLLTATMRADGSTVFSANNKWGYFPSFSTAWRISEEDFMKDINWISNMKLRFGWGLVGNDRISNYLSLDLYEATKYGVGNGLVTTFVPKQLQNANLKWEASSTVNLGIDLGFFDNRLNVTADFFIKNTKDLLLAQSLAHSTGFDNQMQNIGKIQNKGIEIGVTSTNIRTKNFTWDTNFNISFIRNELKSLANGVDAMYARSGFDSNFTQYDYIARVGESLGLIYGYEFDGVYQSSDFYITPNGDYILKEGITNNARYGNLEPGVVKYKDQDGDGVITTNDRTVIGNTLPDWYGGITNNFTYRGIDFSFMFQFNYGNDIFNATRLFATQTRSGRKNFLGEVADRWSPTNASNAVPKADGYITGDIYSRFVEDGSFLRLKNITLGYTFPKKWTRKFFVSKLRVYASGQNLLCFDNYSGYDPEVNSKNSPMTPGVDWGAYPKSRIYTVGIDVQF